MTDTITLTGVVATPPRSLQTASGLSISSFRLASSQRRYDRSRGEWVDADTNWYTITAFRQLADNVTASLTKGDRVVVSGRLRIREWEKDDRSGTSVEVDADSLGHDLHWGTTSFVRTPRPTPSEGQVAQDPDQAPTALAGPHPSPTSGIVPAAASAAGLPAAAAPGMGTVAAESTEAAAAAAPDAAGVAGGGVAAATWGGPLGAGGEAMSTVTTSTPVASAASTAVRTVDEWHSGDGETPF
ncbi:MAG: Single-stranded DNA-binding protein [Frondihabitans sp.]|nr:Single-stranded DNA-binding protein [Frondihabitans sp.]